MVHDGFVEIDEGLTIDGVTYDSTCKSEGINKKIYDSLHNLSAIRLQIALEFFIFDFIYRNKAR